jgi:hypothetical protein
MLFLFGNSVRNGQGRAKNKRIRALNKRIEALWFVFE